MLLTRPSENMNTKNTFYRSCIAVFLAGIAGCGGGGSSSAPASSSQGASGTYPLQQAYASIKASGYQQSVNVAGTAMVNGVSIPVTGSLLVSESPANTSTTFNGQSAQETTTSVTGTISADGQSIAVSDSASDYVSPTGQPLGETSANSYCVTTSFTALPASISVGQSGPYATFACYTDSTMSTPLGNATSTYTIAAGATSDTATLEMTVVASNAGGQQVSSSQTNFQMGSSGNISFSSISVTAIIDGVTVTYNSQ